MNALQWTAPTIETARLTLHGYRREDFEESAAMWADPEVTRYIGGRPFTREEVWARVMRYVGHWVVMGFGFWVVREKASGRFVGEVGLAHFMRELQPSLGDAPECGWALARWSHGKGYATEAVRAALAWGDANLRAERIVCLIDLGNEASLRVAEKCGFREFARATYKGEPTRLFERHSLRNLTPRRAGRECHRR